MTPFDNVIVLVATVAGKGEVSPKICPKIKSKHAPHSSWTNSQAALLSKGFKTSSSAFLSTRLTTPTDDPPTSQKVRLNPLFSHQLYTFFKLKIPSPHHFQLLGADMSNHITFPNLRGAAPEASARCRFRGFPTPVNFVWLRCFFTQLITTHPPNQMTQNDSNPKGSSWNLKIRPLPPSEEKKRILSHEASMGLVYLPTFAWLIHLLIC